jgi:hypothetical protein
MPDAQSKKDLPKCAVKALDGRPQPRLLKGVGVFASEHIRIKVAEKAGFEC